MLEFLPKGLATVIVAAVVAAIVVLIVAGAIRSRKKGSCSHACSCCPNAGACPCHRVGRKQ